MARPTLDPDGRPRHYVVRVSHGEGICRILAIRDNYTDAENDCGNYEGARIDVWKDAECIARGLHPFK